MYPKSCFAETVTFCTVIIFTYILFAKAGNTVIILTLVSIRPVTQCHFLVVVGGKVIVVSPQYNNKKQLL